jgi:hypothetical protein
VRDLQPGELQQYTVIRVADEILVDLMRSAGGIDYTEAAWNVAPFRIEPHQLARNALIPDTAVPVSDTTMRTPTVTSKAVDSIQPRICFP